jgi:glycosyltransferase involved in cell wall biosynthesis
MIEERVERIVLVTGQFPFGTGEAFLAPEWRHLIRAPVDLTVLPVHHGRTRNHDAAVFDLVDDRVVSDSGWGPTFRRRSVAGGVARRVIPYLVRERSRTALWSVRRMGVATRLRELVDELQPDHIHAYSAAAPATLAMVVAEATGVPWSFTAHRSDVVAEHALVDKVRSATWIRCVSKRTSSLLAQRAHTSIDHAEVLHLGVDLPEHARAREPGPTRDVACPASLTDVKGHAVLLEAIRAIAGRVPPTTYHLYGSGPEQRRLRAQTARLGLTGSVRFHGWVPQRTLLDQYAAGEIDAVVVPSVDLGGGRHEGIPMALAEAMAHAVPVIGTSAGGTDELLTAGAGLLVRPGSVSALADALAELLGNTRLRRAVGDRGRERVRSEFNAARTATTFLDRLDPARRPR